MTNQQCVLWLLEEAKKAHVRRAPLLAEFLRDAAAKAAIAHADDVIAAAKYARQYMIGKGE